MATTLEFKDILKAATKREAEIKRLQSSHNLWDHYRPLWSFYISAYESGPDFASIENLFKHVRENAEDYQERAKRVHNMNYCEPLVDFYTHFIFNETIDRNGGSLDAFYREFVKDVDRRGNSVDDFMRQVSDEAQIYGMVYILVDSPPKDREMSAYEEQEEGIRPYWVLLNPAEITDWILDDFGNLVYAKRRQPTEKMVGGHKRSIERYTEWYPDEIWISEVDVTDGTKPVYLGKAIVPNQLGTIPLIVARHKRSRINPHIGLSFLRDFAYNQREVMNLTSLLQEFLYRQAFNILVMEEDPTGIVPESSTSEVTIGSANALTFPRGATHAPAYITPPAEPAKFIQDERQRIVGEMFKRAAQDTVNELFNGEKSSGFSQAQSFSKTVPFISARADMLERVENELMFLTVQMAGKGTWTGKVKYKDRYEITNLTDALTQLQILVRDLQIPSETFVKEELKRMVLEFDGKLPPDKLRKVLDEVEDMTFTSWQKTQKDALVGKGASPGAQQKDKQSGTTMEEVAAESLKKAPAATNKVRDKQNKGK